MAKLRTLARSLHRTGLPRLASYPGGVFLGYHRIRPDPGGDPGLIAGLFGPDRERFHQQMSWLKRHRHILTEDEIIALAEEGRAIPRGCVAISFDDAYRDNYDLALPVLQDLGIQASFFVPFDLIDKRQAGWWEHIAWYCRHPGVRRLEFAGHRFELPADEKKLYLFIVGLYIHRPWEENAGIRAALQERLQAPDLPEEVQDRSLMTWDQLRAMADAGMAIGSHTLTHRVLASLNEEDQRREIFTSKIRLEKELGREMRSFAYPLGGPDHINEDSIRLAREAGYRIAYTFSTGAASRINDPWSIRRIDGTNSLSMLSLSTMFPNFVNAR